MNRTQDWLNRLGKELMESISVQERKRMRARRTKRLAVSIAAVTLLTVFAGAAIAGGIWDDDPPIPAPGSGIVAEPDEPITTQPGKSSDVVTATNTCEFRGNRSKWATGRVDAALLSQLSVLRSEGPGASVPELPGRAFRELARRVDLADGVSFAVVPVSGADVAVDDIPDTPACERFKKLAEKQSNSPDRACITEASSPDGGQTCGTASAIRRGSTYLVEDGIPGARLGTARVFGLVPDGVRSVTLTIRTRHGKVEKRVPVTRNVFFLEFNGSAAVAPEVRLNH